MKNETREQRKIRVRNRAHRVLIDWLELVDEDDWLDEVKDFRAFVREELDKIILDDADDKHFGQGTPVLSLQSNRRMASRYRCRRRRTAQSS